MIIIKVDEAYAFDMLAIMEIKKDKSVQDTINFYEFMENLKLQLGDELTSDIRASESYRELLAANQLVFDMVEQINLGEKLAAEVVHEGNMARFRAKKKLQYLFFGQDLNERKTV